MRTDIRLGRLLGSAFLAVIALSLGSALVRDPVLEGTTVAVAGRVAEDATRLQWSGFLELGTAAGIVALAVLLYTVTAARSPIAARLAFGWWLAEAITLAVSTIGVFVVADLASTSAGPAALASIETMTGLRAAAYMIHMVFYCLGGLLWYALLYRQRSVPRVISGFGVLAVVLALVGTVGGIVGTLSPIAFGLPVGLFELAIGVWLLVRGVRMSEAVRGQPPARTPVPG